MANVVRDGLWPCVCLERVRWAGRAYCVARPLPLCAIRTRRRRRRRRRRRSRRAHRALLKTWQRIRT